MDWSFDAIEHLISNLGYPIFISLVLVFYLGKKEFVQNKKALGRKKDLADIEAIEHMGNTSGE